MLRKILAEQERIQQERLTFQIQKDSDLNKIKEEALLLEERIKLTEGMYCPIMGLPENSPSIQAM